MPDIYGNVIRAIYDNWVHSDSGWILAVEDSGRWRRVMVASPYRITNMMTYGTIWWWRCCVEEVAWNRRVEINYLEEEGNVIHGDTASPCPLWCVLLQCNRQREWRSTDAFRLWSIVVVELSAGSGSCGFTSRQDQDPHHPPSLYNWEQSVRVPLFGKGGS